MQPLNAPHVRRGTKRKSSDLDDDFDINDTSYEEAEVLSKDEDYKPPQASTKNKSKDAPSKKRVVSPSTERATPRKKAVEAAEGRRCAFYLHAIRE